MVDKLRSGKLAVILHADVVGSTTLVQKDEQVAHERIQGAFRRFGSTITKYHGHVRELRGDALLAEFERASDAVTAALVFQAEQINYNAQLNDSLQPTVRAGIAMGEVIIADETITGAGVVLAQRLEQLSEPGGVVIQGAAYETIPGRFPFEYANLGEHKVKGFEEPVRAYSASLRPDSVIPQPSPIVHRIRSTIIAFASVAIVITGIALMWFKPWEVREEPALVERMAFPLPDKPSIAVLPFANMGDDPQQEYFADGMTDDLITDLSKISGLFVIARNSSFAYKDKSPDVRQVARALGVRYVLEGSVRRAGDEVRINTQLIDATTGGHLWAERYDGTLSDVFSLQDRVIARVVSALKITLTDTEQTQLVRMATNNLEAYDYYLRAARGFYVYSTEGRREALQLYQKAIGLDPEFAEAYAGIARVASYVWRWKESSLLPGPVARNVAYQAASKALNLDPGNAQAYSVLALLQMTEGRHDEALESARTAISLQPNDVWGYASLAHVLVYAGQHAEALNAMQTASRLEPRPSPELYGNMGWVLFWNRRYEEAIGALEEALEGGVEYFNTLAMTYAQLGRLEEARAMVAEIHERDPRANLSYYRALYASRHKRAVDLEQLIDALRKAGIPEWPMGYEARVEDRLDTATIETLVFGRTWVGHLSTSGGPFVQEFDKDGKVGFRDADSLLAGSAWVENGMLCVDFPARGVVRKSCGYLYRNPKGASEGQNEYTHVGIESILTFSISP